MDRWFFIEVQTYMSVNNMGRELGQYVYDKYDQTVVHKDCLSGISCDIEEKMTELEEKYPRCKKLKYNVREYEDRYHETVTDLSVKPDNPYNDNCIFILRTKCIRKMNLETSLSHWKEDVSPRTLACLRLPRRYTKPKLEDWQASDAS